MEPKGRTTGMAIETLELSINKDGGTVLFCTTTDTVFGFVFDADVDAVEDFLSYLRGRHYDARELAAGFNSLLPSLRQAWDEFVEAYSCAVCGVGNVKHDDLDYSDCCGKMFCGTHQGDDQWTDNYDGKTVEYGHKC
jgi:hypothetical protein